MSELIPKDLACLTGLSYYPDSFSQKYMKRNQRRISNIMEMENASFFIGHGKEDETR